MKRIHKNPSAIVIKKEVAEGHLKRDKTDTQRQEYVIILRITVLYHCIMVQYISITLYYCNDVLLYFILLGYYMTLLYSAIVCVIIFILVDCVAM